LEAAQYEDNCFVTLTYDDQNLPAKGSLVPKHSQDWLKRFRKLVEPVRIRYFLVGEYGDESQRPHYHAAIFNYPTCVYGQSRGWVSRCCERCELVRESWGFGKVFLGTLETHSAQYVAGYVTKKMTAKDDDRLNGRHPEFARMSLRPGIGRDALWEVASQLMHFNLENTEADVPSALRHGKRLLPLGRYLRRELRKMVGKSDATPEAVIKKLEEEMFPLRLAAASDADAPSVKSQVMLANKGALANLESRTRIFKGRRSL